MSRQTLSVLLLSGWLLMLPPLNKTSDTWKVIVDAPILDWEQIGAYDSANACEIARGRGIEWNETQWGSAPSALVFIVQARRSRCIPADHIYPPKAPSK